MGPFAEFSLGLIIVVVQAALFGVIAWWVASRYSRAWRLVGGTLLVVLGAWPSAVVIINHATGYETSSALDTNVAVLLSLGIGWVVGRKRRLRDSDKLTHGNRPTTP